MTEAEWDRCVVQLTGAWPNGFTRSPEWVLVWYGQLRQYSFPAVAHAVVRAIRSGGRFPPSLSEFLALVGVEARYRAPRPEPEPEPEPEPIPEFVREAMARLRRSTEMPEDRRRNMAG